MRVLAHRATAFLPVFILMTNCANAIAQTTVTSPVNVTVPSVVRLTGSDNITTTQRLVIDQTSISFDTNLTATGAASVVWKGNTNSNAGFHVTVQRSSITGTASNELQSDLIVYGESSPGGDNDVVMLGSYGSGKSLTAVSDAMPEPFCSTNKPGSAMFRVGVRLNAAAAHGKGTVNTVLTFVAAAL